VGVDLAAGPRFIVQASTPSGLAPEALALHLRNLTDVRGAGWRSGVEVPLGLSLETQATEG
jgi:heme oxygenase